MRKVGTTLNDIILQIQNLKGKDVSLEINRGRNKTTLLVGAVENIYPSIFTVRLPESGKSVSYSYADVLCGVVSLKTTDRQESQPVDAV